MPGTFFVSWALWEKLCFVLAAGIVIVVTLGLCKLTYNTWRLRKYAKIKEDTLALKRAMQHSASVRRGRAKEVPFGVRALEKGVEVEGVWNSGANTPAPSLPGSPTLSPSIIKPKAPSEASDRRPSTSASGMSRVTRIEIHPPGDQSYVSSATDSSNRTRPTYKPRRSSGLRFSNSEDVERGDVLTQINTPQLSSGGPSPSGSSSPEDSPLDDSLLHPDRRAPSNASYVSQESNPFLTPTTSRKISTDEPIPMTHLSGLIPTDPHTDPASYHEQLVSGLNIAYGEGHAQPARPFDANRGQRQSQVVRKINSGFEILKPGTFDQQKQSIELGSQWTEVKTAEETKKEPKKLKKKGKRASLV